MDPHAELADEIQQADEDIQADAPDDASSELTQVTNVEGDTIHLDGDSEDFIRKDVA